MLLLPKKVGAFTLLRKLGSGGIAESYVGSHDEAGGRPVVVRRILPYVLRDPARLASIEARANDLIGVRHPFLVHVMDHLVVGEDHYIIEEYIDGVTLDKVLAWCRQAQRTIPHNVFLNIAVQVCNGLEALHARPGRGTGSESVLHLGLKPGSIFITRDGKVMVGSFGLTRSPTTLPQGGAAGPVPTRMEYLSPEQTHPDQKLTPASDIFSLGAILYELLTIESLFRADSNLQTIHKVRRAEATSQLLRVKELMPGLDKILYRALSLNPRHRYQRSFVLREDLRGLMSGYSFASIAEDTRAFAAPLIEALVPPSTGLSSLQDAPLGADGFLDSPDTRIDPDPMTTAAITAQALQERAARERHQLGLISLDEGDGVREHTESTSPQPIEIDPPTTLGAPERAPEDRDRPTIPGTDAEAFGILPPDRDRATRPGVPAGSAARSAKRGPELFAEPTHYEAMDPPADLSPSEPPPPANRKRPRAEPEPAPYVSGSTVVPPEPTAAPNRARLGATAVPVSVAEVPSEPPLPRPKPVRAAPAPTPEPERMEPPPRPPVAAPLPPAEPIRAAPQELPPAPPSETPPPPSMTAAPLSRPMPPPNLSRPMPPPGAVPTAAPVPRPATTMDALKALPLAPAPPPPPPRPVSAATPPKVADPYSYEEPEPPRSSGGLILGVAALVGLGLVATCAGAGWFGWNYYSANAPAPEIAAAPASMGDDAASMLADAAPPSVEPTVDAGSDDAALMAQPTPPAAPVAEPPPEPVAAYTPPPTPAPAPTPVARTTPRESTPEPARTVTYTAPPPRTTTTSARTATTYEPAVAATSTPTYRSAEPAAAPAKTTTTKATTTKTATVYTPPPEETFAAPALDVSVAETPVSTLDTYVDSAKRGQLDGEAVSSLEGVDLSDPQYTRSRALLLMNAQKKSDDSGTRKYLDQILKLPENQYSPVYLTDYARWYVNHSEYDKAIDKAATAERYWSRLPPELVFSKKAEMYEIQAAAWQGKFYKSGGDLELLEKAISDWERYKRHVATKSRSDLAQRADTQIAKLNDIKARLE